LVCGTAPTVLHGGTGVIQLYVASRTGHEQGGKGVDLLQDPWARRQLAHLHLPQFVRVVEAGDPSKFKLARPGSRQTIAGTYIYGVGDDLPGVIVLHQHGYGWHAALVEEDKLQYVGVGTPGREGERWVFGRDADVAGSSLPHGKRLLHFPHVVKRHNLHAMH